MRLTRTLILAAAASAFAGAALAGPVVLRANPVDDDGRVTLGDLFEGAGSAADVVVAQRVGPSVVLEAGQLQAQARQAGLDWANPDGLRRVAVRRAEAPVQGVADAASVPAAAQPVAIMNTTSNRVIDAVASGPGQAVAGPAADAARAAPQQFAAR